MEIAAGKSSLNLSSLYERARKFGGKVFESKGDISAEEMKKLNDVILPTIKTVVEGADLVPLNHFRPWVGNLQAVVSEAEDLIDLYENKKVENQASPLPESKGTSKETWGFMLPKSAFNMCFEKLQKSYEEAEKLNQYISNARETARRQIEHESKQASAITTTSSVSTLSSPLFGRDKECDFIIEKLLVDESHADYSSIGGIRRTPIIAIQGIGGSGKTSIAQHIYKDERIRKHFDLMMWVHVSSNFDVHRLTKEIIESVNKAGCPHINNFDVLQTVLKNSISGAKNFLIVFDDIWCEDKVRWDQLLSPLNEAGGKGSKIIITTRMAKVANILQAEHVISLEELKTEDCWSLLKYYAFNDSEIHTEDGKLINIGNEIINKVKHSPLALKVVGSSLAKQSLNEWENILKQDTLKETIDLLLLSFLNLPSHLQRCFAYCSLFPRGHRFYPNRHLIPLWIAQGFVENTSESRMGLEEQGSIYVKELVSYSFFEELPNSIDTSISNLCDCYMIHDLLHDLAEKVSRKYCHRIEDNDFLHIPKTCVHLSVYSTKDIGEVEMSKFKKLRTLIIDFDAPSIDIFKRKKDFLQTLTNLRALHVNYDVQMEALSYSSIYKLKHLRYLHLKYDKMLPISLAKLYHLQFLHLNTDPVEKNHSLETLDVERYRGVRAPSWMTKETSLGLHRLQYLHLMSCKSLQTVPCLPPHLKTLLVQDCNELMQLPPVVDTLENLCLENCPKLKAPSMSQNSPRLLGIGIERCLREGNQLFDELPFCARLQYLKLEGFSGLQRFPKLSTTVATLSIIDFPSLTSIGNLQCCKSLEIKNCPLLVDDGETTKCFEGVTSFGTDELLLVHALVQQQAFTSIKLLHLDGRQNPFPLLLEEHLYQLSSLEHLELNGFTTLPNLEKLSSIVGLTIRDCPDVELLPNLPTSLQSVKAYQCPNLKLNYGDDGQQRNTISHILRLSFG